MGPGQVGFQAGGAGPPDGADGFDLFPPCAAAAAGSMPAVRVETHPAGGQRCPRAATWRRSASWISATVTRPSRFKSEAATRFFVM